MRHTKSITPQQADGHQTSYAAELQGIAPRGIRQLSVQARSLGSLPAGIKNVQGGKEESVHQNENQN